MQHLPDVLLFKLCSQLDVPDIASLSVSCTRLKSFTDQAEAWLGSLPASQGWVAGDPAIADQLKLFKQQKQLNSLLQTGRWRDALFLAAREPERAAGKVDFASFLTIDEAVMSVGHTLVTDGLLVAIFNAQGVLVRGLLPPAVRYDSISRNRGPSLPMYWRSASRLSRVILQAPAQPLGGLQEWPAARFSIQYKARLLNDNVLAVPTCASTEYQPYPADLAISLLYRSVPLHNVKCLDLSCHPLSDDDIKDLLFRCPLLETLIACGTRVGGLSLMVLGANTLGASLAGGRPRTRGNGAMGPNAVTAGAIVLGAPQPSQELVNGVGLNGSSKVGESAVVSPSPSPMIHLHQHLSHLDLSSCATLSGAGRLTSLVRAAISRLPSLTALNLSNTAMGQALSPLYEPGFAAALGRLTELKVENTEGLTPEVVAALLCSCHKLRKLAAQSSSLAKGVGRGADMVFAALEQVPVPSHHSNSHHSNVHNHHGRSHSSHSSHSSKSSDTSHNSNPQPSGSQLLGLQRSSSQRPSSQASTSQPDNTPPPTSQASCSHGSKSGQSEPEPSSSHLSQSQPPNEEPRNEEPPNAQPPKAQPPSVHPPSPGPSTSQPSTSQVFSTPNVQPSELQPNTSHLSHPAPLVSQPSTSLPSSSSNPTQSDPSGPSSSSNEPTASPSDNTSSHPESTSQTGAPAATRTTQIDITHSSELTPPAASCSSDALRPGPQRPSTSPALSCCDMKHSQSNSQPESQKSSPTTVDRDACSGDKEQQASASSRSPVSLSSSTCNPADKLPHQLPSLYSLSVGWGFGPVSLRAVVVRSPYLQEFSAGIGAGVTDAMLSALAAGCAHLKRLALLMSSVSDTGVNAVLLGCPKLESLRLLHCVGPFTDAITQGLSSIHRVGFTELQMLCAHMTVSNASLATIIGSSRPSLQTLALSGCRRLSNSFISLLHCHAPVLEHLRLEDCFFSPEPPRTRTTTPRNSCDGTSLPRPILSPHLRSRRTRAPNPITTLSLSLSESNSSSSTATNTLTTKLASLRINPTTPTSTNPQPISPSLFAQHSSTSITSRTSSITAPNTTSTNQSIPSSLFAQSSSTAITPRTTSLTIPNSTLTNPGTTPRPNSPNTTSRASSLSLLCSHPSSPSLSRQSSHGSVYSSGMPSWSPRFPRQSSLSSSPPVGLRSPSYSEEELIRQLCMGLRVQKNRKAERDPSPSGSAEVSSPGQGEQGQREESPSGRAQRLTGAAQQPVGSSQQTAVAAPMDLSAGHRKEDGTVEHSLAQQVTTDPAQQVETRPAQQVTTDHSLSNAAEHTPVQSEHLASTGSNCDDTACTCKPAESESPPASKLTLLSPAQLETSAAGICNPASGTSSIVATNSVENMSSETGADHTAIQLANTAENTSGENEKTATRETSSASRDLAMPPGPQPPNGLIFDEKKTDEDTMGSTKSKQAELSSISESPTQHAPQSSRSSGLQPCSVSVAANEQSSTSPGLQPSLVSVAAKEVGGSKDDGQTGTSSTTKPAPVAPDALVKAFDGKELLHLLLQCTKLRSLRLRHCCVINSTFLQRVCVSCPLLHELVVDMCDLNDGLPTIGGDSYWALQHVKVFRCKAVDKGPRTSSEDGAPRVHRRVLDGSMLLINRADGRVLPANEAS